MYKENIGSKLKKYREKNKLSISEVADKLNIKESKIEKFESDIKKPNLYQIKKLSNLYNIDMNNIIESKKIVDEVILRRRLDILEFLTITILIILFCINILNKNVTTNSTNIYKFSGDSDHFKFDNGIYVSGSNKYIDISNFDVEPLADFMRAYFPTDLKKVSGKIDVNINNKSLSAGFKDFHSPERKAHCVNMVADCSKILDEMLSEIKVGV